MESIRKRWSQIVGNPLAEHTFPLHLRFRKLTLLVDSPAWMQELCYLQPELLRRLQEALGDSVLSEIRFTVGSFPRKDAPDQGAAENLKPLSNEELSLIQESLRPIKNPDVKESLRRLMERALQAGDTRKP
jgi:hypothetical protein